MEHGKPITTGIPDEVRNDPRVISRSSARKTDLYFLAFAGVIGTSFSYQTGV